MPLIPAHRQADRLCYVDVEHVEPACIPIDLGEQPALLITHMHDAVFHQYLVPTLVQLPHRDNVGGQPW
jgi:hypothetical protein